MGRLRLRYRLSQPSSMTRASSLTVERDNFTSRPMSRPNDVHAIELHGEGGVILECLKSDPLARGYERVRV